MKKIVSLLLCLVLLMTAVGALAQAFTPGTYSATVPGRNGDLTVEMTFDEGSILLTTRRGGLEIQGEGLHIEKLSLDGGDLKVEGLVTSLTYDMDAAERGGGLLRRLLGG